MTGPYDPVEPAARMIDQFEKEIEFAHAGGQMIDDAVMISIGITILEQTSTLTQIS